MTITTLGHIDKNLEKYNQKTPHTTLAVSALMDYHVHDYRSRDAPFAKIEDYVSEAEKRGIKEIAFTTHLIVSGQDKSTSIKLHEIEDYLSDIWKIGEETQVCLKTGFEVDYIPKDEKSIAKILDEYNLDFVLGSIHDVHGLNITVNNPSNLFFHSKRTSEVLDEYYHLWKMAVESELFDVMSHPDYFRKIVNEKIHWSQYGNVVYEAIDALKSHEVGFEINTSGYRHGIDDNFPRDEFIQTAIDSGVKIITLGSDSHLTATIGYRLKDAAKTLDDLGIKQVSTFTERREKKVSINKILKDC
jgi:histidinol-phosphatase (PHP family)